MNASFLQPSLQRAVLALMVGLCGTIAGRSQPASAAPALEPIAHDVPRLPADARRVEVTGERADLVLGFVLRRDDPAGFERYLADVYDRRSPDYLKFLDPVGLAERFGPSPAVQDALLGYLSEHGMEPVEVALGGQLITVRTTRAAAERALAIEIDDYATPARRFHANDRAPSLPAPLAGHVEAIVGLSDAALPRGVTVDQALNLCGAVTVVFGVIPATMLLAYFVGLICTAGQIASNPTSPFDYCGFLPPPLAAVCSGIAIGSDPPFPNPFAGGASGGGTANPPAGGGGSFKTDGNTRLLGTGQIVGITSFSGFDPDDVADWLALMGIDPARIDRLTRVPIAGGAPVTPAQTEVLLDIAAVWSIAPEAEIRIYEAPFSGAGSSFQSLFAAMIDDGVDVISNSFAYCESDTTAADVNSIDSILQTAAAAGISVFSASGDLGSTCLNGLANTAHVPSSSPNLTAVGGSTLSFGLGFTYGGENWWDGSADTPVTGQGGFGQSAFFARPAYQDGLNLSPMRSLPDVVINADPATGYLLCQADDGGCPTGKLYGGTSVAAPIWAGFAALLNEAQGANLGFLNPLIYPHAGTEAFHDATSMATDFAHVGLGSPNLDVLFRMLNAIPEGLPDAAASEVRFAGAVLGGVAGLPVQGIPADGDGAAVIVATLRDAAGHTVSGRDVALAADSMNAVIDPATPVTTDANGQAAFLVRNLEAEIVTLTATDTAAMLDLLDEPIVPFGVPPAGAAGIMAFPTTVNADGVSTTTITVTVQDGLARPAPGKQIRLAQGGGRSVISGPVPPVTDVNGEIQFTATNRNNETVTYTANIVTDGDIAVPGSADVTFQNGAGGCGSDLPAGRNGYTVVPFATGFDAGSLFFGNVNFGDCVAAGVPTFRNQQVFIADARSGEVFEFPPEGGAAMNPIATIGPSLAVEAVGQDGKLYARRVATTGNFNTGAILELDPATGAAVRTVASNLKCPHNLAVDPLSGDLFFDDFCFGAGADDPNVYRVRDPGGSSPVVELYATLPDTPNGRMSFAPDGTLYVVTGYTDPQPLVMRVSGTDQPQPPTVEAVPDVHSIYWLSVVEAGPGGDAQTLAVLQLESPSVVVTRLVDLSTSPATVTDVAEAVGPGTVGPDGCLYFTRAHTVYKLLDPSGGCSFQPSGGNPMVQLALGPASPPAEQGATQTLVATLTNLAAPTDTPIAFRINGANEQFKLARANAQGEAQVSYQGILTGQDRITATALLGGSQVVSNTVTIDWLAGRKPGFLSLNESALSGFAGQLTTVTAALVDVSTTPPTPVAGATIDFVLDAANCSAMTDALGRASCDLSPPTPGDFPLTASFPGTPAVSPASDAATFRVLDPSPIFRDSFEDLGFLP